MKIIERIKEGLVKNVESACRFLFPHGGNIKGRFFEIGDIHGTEGDSLKVNLSDGLWQDFSNDIHKGNLFDLFVFRFGDQKQAIDQSCSFLGIPRVSTSVIKKKRFWKKPTDIGSQLTETSDVFEYLNEERGISLSVLKEYNVRQNKKKNGYIFLRYDHETNDCCGAKTTLLERTDRGKKQEFQSEEPKSVLWGWGTCDKSHKSITVTEGEIDAMSYASQGIKNVVSLPSGVNNLDCIENSWEFLSDYDRVNINFDNDQHGIACTDKFAARVGMERCFKVDLPDTFKDANEAHLAGYNLKDAIKNAKEFKPDKLVSAYDISTDSWQRAIMGKRELLGIPFCGWVGNESVKLNIRPKEMTLYSGFPGSGKSSVLYQNSAYLAFKCGQKLLIASLEEDAEDILRVMFVMALGREFVNTPEDRKLFMMMAEYSRDKIFFYHHRNRASYEDVMKHAEFAIRKHGVQHFILDSVAKTNLDIEDNKEANKFVEAMTSSMNDTGAHYHIVAHARKGDDREFSSIPGLQEIKGANAFGVETFNCVVLWRNVVKEGMLAMHARKTDMKGNTDRFIYLKNDKKVDVEEFKKTAGDTIFKVCKQKVGGEQGQYQLFFNRTNYRFRRTFEEQDETYLPSHLNEKYTTEENEDVPT